MSDGPRRRGAGGLPDASPDWFLAGFDTAHDQYQFARVSRATYRDSPFLDHRINPRPQQVVSRSGSEVDRLLGSHSPEPAAWIFHTAFCCSTLLANCLEHDTRTLVLREPAVLSLLAARLRQHDPPPADGWVRRIVQLTERSYGAARVVVKPSNYANALAGRLLAPTVAPARASVMLSCSLRSLLVSVLKKQDEASRLLESFTAALLEDTDYRERIALPPLEKLSLLRQGVVFWHGQRHQFSGLLRAAPSGRVLPLTMEAFLQQPLATLSAVNRHFGLGLNDQDLKRTASAGALRRHAKAGESYGPERRRLEAAAVAARHEDELRAALSWAESLLKEVPVTPLVEGEDPLAG